MVNEVEKREVRLLMQNSDNRLDFVIMNMHTPVYNLKLHYNDDLLPMNEVLLHRLNKANDKGLLFVPASLAKNIGNPEFLTLLNDYKNSILIIEDADNILRKRGSDDDHVIANLLNLSDGVLSDFFHIQIICTFNNDISLVDPALLRKGRLIAKYYFKELSLEKTRQLCTHLGYDFVPEQEMTLADVFHLQEQEFQQSVYNKGAIGFK
jgi:hypothetical protein